MGARGTRARRALVVGAAAVGMAVSGVLPAVPAAAEETRTTAAVPALRWVDCYDGRFACATAHVPLDYDAPRGDKVALALVKLRATDPARRIGTLFVNPGGPGGSGTEWVRGAAEIVYSPQLRARFDVVGFDPRGVQRSNPATCFATRIAEGEFFERLPVFPVTAREEAQTVAGYDEYARRCATRSAAIMRHMSTANVARDLDLLRRAVGDDRLTYAGYSYGSYLGATYANLFPNRVRALVVDGVLDPVAWATGRGGQGSRVPFSTRLGSAESSRATLDAFLRACDRVGDRCAFSGGDPRAKLERLLARLRREPLRGPDGEVLFGYAAFVSGITGLLYYQDAWASLGGTLQDAYDRAFGGPSSRTAAAPEDPVGYDNSFDAFNAVTCVDTDNPAGPAAWSRAADASDRRAAPFGRLWTWESAACAGWRVGDADRYKGPFTRRTSAPVLVVGNRLDPSTPYAGALALSRLLPRSRLLTLDYAGHTSLGQSRCASRHTEAYLLRGALPPAGTVCPSDRRPFDPVPTELAGLRLVPAAPYAAPAP